MLWAAVAWVGYLAVEPHFRRHWPTQLVTWSRLLERRIGDPMVSRHVLLGVLAALLFSLMTLVIGIPPPVPDSYLSGVARLGGVGASIAGGLALVSLLAVAHFLLRHRRLSVTAFVVVFFGFAWIVQTTLSGPLRAFGLAIVLTLAIPVLLLRAGLLPMLVGTIVYDWLVLFPMTVDRSVWFFRDSMLTLGALLALTLWAFYHSLGGRPMFGDDAVAD